VKKLLDSSGNSVLLTKGLKVSDATVDLDRQYDASYYQRNKERLKANAAKWRERNPERVKEAAKAKRKRYLGKNKERLAAERRSRTHFSTRDKYLLATYGITGAQYEALHTAQGGVCSICREPEVRKSQLGRVHRMSVDHNHQTGQIRGLLCARCNHVIGHVREDISLLNAMKNYINDWNSLLHHSGTGDAAKTA
jgi:DNA segregation ATPase FtsK/SpoIIIE-like protein